jgi:hypothetical protein
MSYGLTWKELESQGCILVAKTRATDQRHYKLWDKDVDGLWYPSGIDHDFTDSFNTYNESIERRTLCIELWKIFRKHILLVS